MKKIILILSLILLLSMTSVLGAECTSTPPTRTNCEVTGDTNLTPGFYNSGVMTMDGYTTLDCKGATLNGTGSNQAVQFFGDDITLKNCIMTNWGAPFYGGMNQNHYVEGIYSTGNSGYLAMDGQNSILKDVYVDMSDGGQYGFFNSETTLDNVSFVDVTEVDEYSAYFDYVSSTNLLIKDSYLSVIVSNITGPSFNITDSEIGGTLTISGDGGASSGTGSLYNNDLTQLIISGANYVTAFNNSIPSIFLAQDMGGKMMWTDTDGVLYNVTTPTAGLVLYQNTMYTDGTHIINDGVDIGASDIILDCRNSQMDGGGINSGIQVINNADNIEIKRCRMTQYAVGINLKGSDSENITIHDNWIAEIGAWAMDTDFSDGNKNLEVYNNNFTTNDFWLGPSVEVRFNGQGTNLFYNNTLYGWDTSGDYVGDRAKLIVAEDDNAPNINYYIENNTIINGYIQIDDNLQSSVNLFNNNFDDDSSLIVLDCGSNDCYVNAVNNIISSVQYPTLSIAQGVGGKMMWTDTDGVFNVTTLNGVNNALLPAGNIMLTDGTHLTYELALSTTNDNTIFEGRGSVIEGTEAGDSNEIFKNWGNDIVNITFRNFNVTKQGLNGQGAEVFKESSFWWNDTVMDNVNIEAESHQWMRFNNLEIKNSRWVMPTNTSWGNNIRLWFEDVQGVINLHDNYFDVDEVYMTDSGSTRDFSDGVTLKLYNNYFTHSGSNNNGIPFNDMRDVEVYNNTFDNIALGVSGVGDDTTAELYNVTVRDNHWTDGSAMLFDFAGWGNTNASLFRIYDNTGTGVMYVANTDDVVIRDNNFNLTNQWGSSSVFNNVHELIIENNTFPDAGSLGFGDWGGIVEDFSFKNNDVTVSNGINFNCLKNVVIENNNIISDSWIVLRDTCGLDTKDVLIKDNDFIAVTGESTLSVGYVGTSGLYDNVTMTGNTLDRLALLEDHNAIISDNTITSRVSFYVDYDNIDICDGGIGNTYLGYLDFYPFLGVTQYNFDIDCPNLEIPDGILIRGNGDYGYEINGNEIAIIGTGAKGLSFSGVNNSLVSDLNLTGFNDSVVFELGTVNNKFVNSTVDELPVNLGYNNVFSQLNVLGLDETVVTPGYDTNITEDVVFVEGVYESNVTTVVSADGIEITGGGALLLGESLTITADDVVVSDMTVENPMNVTGSNIVVNNVNVTYANYSEFQDIGETTELATVENISNVDLILDNHVGKIVFNVPIDLTLGGDLDAYVTIADNEITVENTNLNVPATITFKDTGFTSTNDFFVYKDGALCETSDCLDVRLSSGDNVDVDVTGFSTYSLLQVGLQISQENYFLLRGNFLWILGAFGTVVIILAATFLAIFVTGGKFDLTTISIVVLMLAVGFAALLAVFVSIMNLFGAG